MTLSVFDLFKIGIGPSSSHTVGPMWAALRFVQMLGARDVLGQVWRMRTDLYGSLALTGRGHATDKAILLGLSGERPDTIDHEAVEPLVEAVRSRHTLRLAGRFDIRFDETDDLVFHGDESLPRHPNGLRLTAFDAAGRELAGETYYSVGGGFVINEVEAEAGFAGGNEPAGPVPHEFNSASELLEIGRRTGLSIANIVRQNEAAWRTTAETDAGLDRIWAVMEQCIARLSGRGRPTRRPASAAAGRPAVPQPPDATQGGGSAGRARLGQPVRAGGQRGERGRRPGRDGTHERGRRRDPGSPGLLRPLSHGGDLRGVRDFLLTAGAVGMLYKRNASLSAAEMGCQGEVGVACSMAAAGLAAVMGGSNEQVENAAEIGMEHNLGLTCDPIGGLVQVPCIERNTMGAAKAINAARLAVLHGDGTHRVPLDRVIETMRQTGLDMQDKYKETSQGGLAVNVVNC